MLFFVLLCTTLCTVWFCNPLDEEERALLLLSFKCLVTVNVMWLFLSVPRVGLQFVIVVFPYHTHLLFTYHITGYERDRDTK